MPDNKKNDNFSPAVERYKKLKEEWDRELANDRENFRVGKTKEKLSRGKESRQKELAAQREKFRIKSRPEELEAERERFRIKPKMGQSGYQGSGSQLPDYNFKREDGQNEEKTEEQDEETSRENEGNEEENRFDQYEEGKKLAHNQDKSRKEKEEKKKEEAAEGILSEKNPFKKIQRILDLLSLFSGAGSCFGDIFVSVPTFFLLHLEFLVPFFLPNYKIARWKKILVFMIDIYIFMMFGFLIIMITVISDKTGGTMTGAAWFGIRSYLPSWLGGF